MLQLLHLFMTPSTSEIELARRHVAEGLEHIRRQEALIRELETGGHSTDTARELLRTLLESQRLHEDNLERLIAMNKTPC